MGNAGPATAEHVTVQVQQLDLKHVQRLSMARQPAAGDPSWDPGVGLARTALP